MRLSIAIAVHNEEKNIIRCLKSVYGWADEIVIVDGASTDNTIQILEEFSRKKSAEVNFERLGIPRAEQTPTKSGASSHEGGLPLESQNSTSSSKIKLIRTSNPPMFHLNKQKAIEACTGDWILQLDGDEVVSNDLKKEILEIVNTKKKDSGVSADLADPQNNVILASRRRAQNPNKYNFRAYWLPRLNYFLGKPLRKGGQYPDYTIRLYRNGVARFPCKSVHENVEIIAMGVPKRGAPNKPQPQVGYLKSDLLHFPYPTFRQYLNKWHRYNQLEAEKLKKDNVKPSLGLFIDYVLIKPPVWFFRTYLRHKGFMDGIPGFVFSFFSAIRYWNIYMNLL